MLVKYHDISVYLINWSLGVPLDPIQTGDVSAKSIVYEACQVTLQGQVVGTEMFGSVVAAWPWCSFRGLGIFAGKPWHIRW